MQIFTNGTARIRHSETGDVYEIDSSEIDWQQVGADERQMGSEVFYEAIVEHPQLGTLTWEISEYPVGAENFRQTDVGEHQLIEDFDFGFAHEPEEPDDWEERQPRIDEMVEWFFENYEDPVHGMPYISKEGGYQYIRGGAYDAREVLADQFPEVPEELHDAAVKRIEQDGTFDWAPVDRGLEPEEPSPDFDDEDEDLEIPDQEPGLQFGFGADGRVTLLIGDQPRPNEIDEIEGLHDELRDAAARLVDSLAGTNAHGRILSAAQAYQKAIEADPISVSRVYGAGIRLENAQEALRRSDDLPPLPEGPDEALSTVLELHGVFITSTEHGRILLQRARDYARTTAETEEDRARKAQLADAIANAPDLFEEETRELTSGVLKESGTGPFPERTSEVSWTAAGNLLKTLGKAAGWLVLAGVAPGFVESIPGQILADGTTIAANALWAFITQHIGLLRELAAAHGPDMGPVRAVLDRISRRIG